MAQRQNLRGVVLALTTPAARAALRSQVSPIDEDEAVTWLHVEC